MTDAFFGRRARLAALVGLLLPLAATAAYGQVRIDRSWLTYDSSASQLAFTLVAGLGGANGGMNFNGATNGAILLTVPLGWQVTMKFRNADQMQPHSAVVLPLATPIPATAGAPAFTGAATRRVMQGTPPDGHEDVTFTAGRAGQYIIFCGVPGHGLAGMWLRLDVVGGAARPAITVYQKPG